MNVRMKCQMTKTKCQINVKVSMIERNTTLLLTNLNFSCI